MNYKIITIILLPVIYTQQSTASDLAKTIHKKATSIQQCNTNAQHITDSQAVDLSEKNSSYLNDDDFSSIEDYTTKDPTYTHAFQKTTKDDYDLEYAHTQDRYTYELLKAASEDDTQTIHTIISNKLSTIDSTDDHDQTALIHAISNNSSKATKLLLDYQANPDHKGCSKVSPLMIAIRNRNTEIANLLLGYGADIYEEFDFTQLTPHKEKHHQFLEFFFEYKTISPDKVTPIMLASYYNLKSVATNIEDRLRLDKELSHNDINDQRMALLRQRDMLLRQSQKQPEDFQELQKDFKNKLQSILQNNDYINLNNKEKKEVLSIGQKFIPYFLPYINNQSLKDEIQSLKNKQILLNGQKLSIDLCHILLAEFHTDNNQNPFKMHGGHSEQTVQNLLNTRLIRIINTHQIQESKQYKLLDTTTGNIINKTCFNKNISPQEIVSVLQNASYTKIKTDNKYVKYVATHNSLRLYVVVDPQNKKIKTVYPITDLRYAFLKKDTHIDTDSDSDTETNSCANSELQSDIESDYDSNSELDTDLELNDE